MLGKRGQRPFIWKNLIQPKKSNNFLKPAANPAANGKLQTAKVLLLPYVIVYNYLMKKLRVYIDTSVIGGCFDDEFALWSNGLLQDFKKGHFEPVISTLTAEEILNAPENVRKVFQQFTDLEGTC